VVDSAAMGAAASESEMEVSKTDPRVKPSPTRRVTEIILPVKRSAPFSLARREVIGSCFREREIAMARPIDQA
jgi:hypothetical protein